MDNTVALQFFPTPPELGDYMWRLFKHDYFGRVLEPHGGDGALAKADPRRERYMRGSYTDYCQIDCCEIDVAKHAALREAGMRVVGVDFLEFTRANQYGRIIMNPPFQNGDKHLLHAWDLMHDGEIVSLLNAETLRKLISKDRIKLSKLIEEHGTVEFREETFIEPVTNRKVVLDIAIVYLRKRADMSSIVGDLLRDLSGDTNTEDSMGAQFADMNELAVPNSQLENLVVAFNAAVLSMTAKVHAEAKASYYAALLGDTLARRQGVEGAALKPTQVDAKGLSAALYAGYEELKDRAWASVLDSTDVRSRLSQRTARDLERQFEEIKQLEFTLANVRAFLLGLVQNQGKLQLDVCCDAFDAICRFSTDNCVWIKGYRPGSGWYSNNVHARGPKRLKYTRFIIPGHSNIYGFVPYETRQFLNDLDLAFATLDGRQQPEEPLTQVFEENLQALRDGERVSSSYLDIRYYPGVGTIHFFPRRKDLMDRLNRVVGRQRQWLPQEGEKVSDDFWRQYEMAETLDKRVRAGIRKRKRNSMAREITIVYGRTDAEIREVETIVNAALDEVLEEEGISTQFLLEGSEREGSASDHRETAPARQFALPLLAQT